MDELSSSDAARLSTLTLDVLTAALADALDAQNAVPPHTRRQALMARITPSSGETSATRT
jgi:hypothetical protein